MKLYVYAITAIIGVHFMTGCASFDPCENTLVRQANSPDGKLKAVVFSRGCGATTSESTQISILPSEASLPKEAGNIFIADEANVYVKWVSAHQLQITAPTTAKIFEKKYKYDSVTIVYK